MTDRLTPDLCVVGGGSAGLSVAAGAVQMGASVVLVERGAMGGDCLNVGCVPSKALLAAAHAARAARHATPLGVGIDPPRVDMARVRAHVRDVIAGIAPHDSPERFRRLGVTVLEGEARFVAPRLLRVEGREGEGWEIAARRIVLATGSRPQVPPIPGLDEGPFLTNETLFDLDRLPEHLVILGGGPIGCEMALAFASLGARVSLIEGARLLARDDPDLVAPIRAALVAEGVEIHEGQRARAVHHAGGRVRVDIAESEDGPSRVIEGSDLLVALGRRPSLSALDLAAGGIAHTDRGITVDSRLRANDKRVYAIGDAHGGLQFTHVAGYEAGVVIKSALFRLPAKADLSACPRVTYTDPELAQVGLTEAAARDAGLKHRVLVWPLADNDRARAERATEGLVKVVVTPRGKILGAGIAGRSAGELIQPWILAMHAGLSIGKIATMIAPYPTLGEAGKRAAGSFYTDSLFGPRTRRLVRFLARFG